MAGNRDEFYARPTSPAAFWPDHPFVFGGRDLEKSGTWLGVTRQGRFAALTNIRDPASRKTAPRSRGHLVSGFLLARQDPEAYLAHVAKTAGDYDDFNLIVADGGTCASLDSRARSATRLASGVYGLSNHLLNTPWPKVVRAKAAFASLLTSAQLDTGQFFSLLADRTPAADADLPHTGVGMEWERALSPVFIALPGYGTRASTVVLFHRDGTIHFHERSFGEGGKLLDVGGKRPGEVEQQIPT